MDEETKRLKLDGVAPRTPPQSDSEDDLAIEEIREKRKEDEKEKKKKNKEAKKQQMKDFYKSLGTSCWTYTLVFLKARFKTWLSRIPNTVRWLLGGSDWCWEEVQ